MTHLFHQVRTSQLEYSDLCDTLVTHENITFSLHVPRAFHLRLLTITTSCTTLHVRMATALTLDLLYHLLSISLDLPVGTFSLYSQDTLLTRRHECRHLVTTQLHLVHATNSPHFLCPHELDQLAPVLYLINHVQICHDDHTLSPPASPVSPVYQYLITGALGRNFVLLPTPTLSALKDYLHTHFGTSDFLFFQHGKRSTHSLVAAPIELRIPLHGGSLLHVKGIFGTCHVTLPVPTISSLQSYFLSLYPFQDFYFIQQGRHIQSDINPHVPIYVLGRLRGGMKANKHQSTPPIADKPKQPRQNKLDTGALEDIISSEDELMDPRDTSTMSVDDKLTLILRTTQATRRDSKHLQRTVRSLEQEFASSSTRLETVESQLSQLQRDFNQFKVTPNSNTDPPSRRSSIDSVGSTFSVSPEIMAKKLRTLYFRGFPIDTRSNITQWIKEQNIPDSEEVYTIGHLADTAVVIFKSETSLWTFLRQCPNNKWLQYKTSQIYVGLDNQIRGQRPEENKAVRKLYRACIQVLSPQHPGVDISQTHVYRSYSKNLVKIHNGTDWEDVAQWDSNVGRMIFSKDDTEYENVYRTLMR